ncbi:hypothetical protein, partial [uncultured Dubosiella sp.]|uniref:hypothetical protein n=1 Tax=uncultured Dubosiella sp. TaxID=1937011 RepID=UPI00262DC15F
SCIHELLSQTKTIQIFDLKAFGKKRFHQSSGQFITSFSKAMQHLASAFSPARILNDCAILIPCVLAVFAVRHHALSPDRFFTLLFLWNIAPRNGKGSTPYSATCPDCLPISATSIKSGTCQKKEPFHALFQKIQQFLKSKIWDMPIVTKHQSLFISH